MTFIPAQGSLTEVNATMSERSADTLARRAATLRNLDVELDAATRTLWMAFAPEKRPSVTLPLMKEIALVQEDVRRGFASAGEPPPIDYCVFGSRTPGIYNLGGDLELFVELIRAGDREAIRRYARLGVDVVWNTYNAFHAPIVTMALVQGDALGGGFEWALSFDVLVAERSAKLGLPEILFNLFPGMGAYSLLSRRVGAPQAEKMMTSGRLYTAEELHGLGIVDVLAEDGEGEQAVAAHIERMSRKRVAHRAIYDARRRVSGLTHQELIDVVEIWCDAAMQLGEPDLRRMQRLVSAQDRRVSELPSAGRMAAE